MCPWMLFSSRLGPWLLTWPPGATFGYTTGRWTKGPRLNFKRTNLFGQALDLLLTENKDKRKVLATPKGDQHKSRKYSFVCGHRKGYNQRGGFPHNQQSSRPQFFPPNQPFTGQEQGVCNRA